MPQIGLQDDVMVTNQSAGGYQYSATKVDNLSALAYTISTVVVDVSGSVYDFKAQIEQMLELIRLGCMKCDNNLNLLHRVTTFNHALNEIHGFRELVTVQPGEYNGKIHPGGNTALTDAACEALDSVMSYAETLAAKDYTCNAVITIITDGEENSSAKTEAAIKKLVEQARKGEHLESINVVLVGLVPKGSTTSQELEKWQKASGIDRYLCADAATAQKWAKVADFVSQSVSSTSKALGKGHASQPIAATF